MAATLAARRTAFAFLREAWAPATWAGVGLAAVAALASSQSTLRGIAHLRGHETDRLAALVTEINKLGGKATETADGIHIDPAKLHGGQFATYSDHRIAMAGAVLGLAVSDLLIEDIATTSKTLPDFANMWQEMVNA